MTRIVLVSVRTVSIGGVPYLQVVSYVKQQDGRTKIDVVRSFGRETMENRMKAEQFANSYNTLKDLASQFKNQRRNNDDNDLLSSALAIFGVILGAGIIAGIIHEIFRDD